MTRRTILTRFQKDPARMGRMIFALLGLVILVALAGGVYIAMGDIPPPTETVEKTLPNARFE